MYPCKTLSVSTNSRLRAPIWYIYMGLNVVPIFIIGTLRHKFTLYRYTEPQGNLILYRSRIRLSRWSCCWTSRAGIAAAKRPVSVFFEFSDEGCLRLLPRGSIVVPFRGHIFKFRILQSNPKKELLWSPWVEAWKTTTLRVSIGLWFCVPVWAQGLRRAL